MIYSVDSTVQLLNNPDQLISYYEEDVTVSEMPTLVVRKVLMFPSFECACLRAYYQLLRHVGF